MKPIVPKSTTTDNTNNITTGGQKDQRSYNRRQERKPVVSKLNMGELQYSKDGYKHNKNEKADQQSAQDSLQFQGNAILYLQ